MKQFDIQGMSCAACSARVEKAVSGLDGVTECSVNLLTNSMLVDGTTSEEDIIKAVESAGYGATLKGKMQTADQGDTFVDKETPFLIKRLISSLLFLLGIKLYGETLIGLFTDNNSRTEVIKMGIIKLEIVAGSYILLIPNQVLNGVLKGMGRAVVPTVINAFCVCVLRMVWMFAAYPLNPTLNMVYTAYPISWATSSIAIAVAYIVIKRKLFKNNNI